METEQHNPKDIDALFDHMEQNLGHEPGDEKQWVFMLESPDTPRLEAIAEALRPEFGAEITPMSVVGEDGVLREQPPVLRVLRDAALSRGEVKELQERFSQLADQEEVSYWGVTCYDVPDFEAMFGWLDLEEAQWRLRYFTDTGLAEGEAMLFEFAVETAGPELSAAVARALAAEGYDSVAVLEPDVEAGEEHGLLVGVEGQNDEDVLARHYRHVEHIALQSGGTLLGVQFPVGDEEEWDEEE